MQNVDDGELAGAAGRRGLAAGRRAAGPSGPGAAPALARRARAGRVRRRHRRRGSRSCGCCTWQALRLPAALGRARRAGRGAEALRRQRPGDRVRGRSPGWPWARAMALVFAAAALHSRVLDRVLTPLVVASQTVPVIALAPLLVLWFGYGALPRVIVCALIAFFPMAVTTLQGLPRHRPSAAAAAALGGRAPLGRLLAGPGAGGGSVSGRRPAHRRHPQPGGRGGGRVDRHRPRPRLPRAQRQRAPRHRPGVRRRASRSPSSASPPTARSCLLERKLCWWNLPDDGTSTKEGFA